MSLQVWLPLNNSFHNQGLVGWNPSASTTPSYVNGKLGKALSTGATTMPASVTSQVLNNTAFSYACWIYINGTPSGSNILFGYNGMSAQGGRQYSIFNYPTYNDFHWSWQNKIGSSYSTVASSSITGVFPSNTWTHLAVTYQNPNGKIYINGVLRTTFTGTYNTDSFAYDTPVIHNDTNRYLCDVRVYNHCLSESEVKQISKGLVLHYPLSMHGQENLVTGSNTNSTSTNKWIGHSAVGGNTSTIEVDETGTNCVKVTRDSTTQSSWDYLSYDALLRNQLKTNTTYTVSFDAKPSVDGTINLSGFMNGNATNNMTVSVDQVQISLLANRWNHCVYHCTTLDSFDGIAISGQVVYLSRSASLRGVNTTVLFKNIKVEEGEIATPWIPNPTDTIYTALGFNDGIEYDVSGYMRNGVKNNIIYSSNTPKYNTSSVFDGTSGYISLSYSDFNPLLNGGTTPFTITFWFYHSDTTRGILFGDYNLGGSNFNIELTTGHKIRFYWNGSPDITFAGNAPISTWIHVALVYDGNNTYYYENGILVETRSGALSAKTKTNGEYRIGRDSRSDYTMFNGQLSDFRIYSTALSASDILELYQTHI